MFPFHTHMLPCPWLPKFFFPRARHVRGDPGRFDFPAGGDGSHADYGYTVFLWIPSFGFGWLRLSWFLSKVLTERVFFFSEGEEGLCHIALDAGTVLSTEVVPTRRRPACFQRVKSTSSLSKCKRVLCTPWHRGEFWRRCLLHRSTLELYRSTEKGVASPFIRQQRCKKRDGSTQYGVPGGNLQAISCKFRNLLACYITKLPSPRKLIRSYITRRPSPRN